MKYFLAFALIATVASAAYLKPTGVTAEVAEIQEIIAAINNPSTNPATAAALEQMLLEALGVTPEQVVVGPAIVEAVYEPISVGPAIIDFPLPDGGAVSAVEPSPVAVPSPAVVAEPTANTPLVQIILNINQATLEASPAVVAPGIATEILPTPVHVVESAAEPVQVVESPIAPVEVVETAPVSPVQVVDVSPIQVVETAPVAVEPVVIGTPIIPSPAVVLPEELN